MQLTHFSDFSLRVLLYLSAHPGRWVPLPEIAVAYDVSQNHLAKVVRLLLDLELVETLRGRSGGLRLAREPGAINIGAVVRATEPTVDLVECFDADRNTCPIAAACGLKAVLLSARESFFRVLDAHTLADFAPRAPALIELWHRPPLRGE